MLRRIFLLPTLSEWKNWSLPSKMGLIGFYITIVGFLMSIFPIIFAPPSSEKIVSELEELNTKRDWSSMSKKLDSIATREDTRDAYYFFKGRLCTYNPTCLEGAEYFLSKINPDSIYFQRASSNLVLFTRKSNAYQQNPDALREKLRRIADEQIKSKSTIPLYYFVKLMSLNDMNYTETSKLFDEFISRYESIFDFTHYPLVMYPGEGGVARIDWSYDVLAIFALFEVKLAIAAHNNNLLEKKMEAIKNWKTIYEKISGASLIQNTNTSFSKQSTRIIIIDNGEIPQKYTSWSYSNLYNNMAMIISIIERPNEHRKVQVSP